MIKKSNLKKKGLFIVLFLLTIVILVGANTYIFFQPENKYVEDKYEYFPRDATNNPAKSVPYINPAPHNILNKAD